LPEHVYHDSDSRFCVKHTAERRARTAKRRAAELRATPKWADQSAINAVYKMARTLEIAERRKYHVDHVIPLRGANVCGLHIAENLAPIPARENAAKSNRFAG
jgi:hypothetical protein